MQFVSLVFRKNGTVLLLFWGDKPVRLRFGVRRCCAAFGRHLERENNASRLRHRHPAKQACPRPKCPGRTHPLTDFRNAAPTSSRQVLTIRLITFARPSARCFGARSSHHCEELFVETRSLGSILESLPLCGSFSGRFGKGEQPLTNVGRASYAYQ